MPSCLHFTLKYTEAESVGKCANPVPILRDSLFLNLSASRNFRPLFRVKHQHSRMCAKICANLEKKSGAIQVQHLPLEPQTRKGFWWGWHSWHTLMATLLRFTRKTQGKVRILRPSSETALSAPAGLLGTAGTAVRVPPSLLFFFTPHA